MNREQEEKFKVFRRDEEKYWDAMNDGRWQRCGEISNGMDRELERGGREREQYEQWKKNEENRERAIDALNREYDEKRKQIK